MSRRLTARTRDAAPRRPRALREQGQTLVEMALVMPVFFLLLFAIIDGGRLVIMNSSLSQAAREGARQGSVEASWIASSEGSCNTTGGPICPATVDAFKSHVVSAVNRAATLGSIPSANVFMRCDLTTPPTGSWTGQACDSASRTTGDYLSVRVVSTFTPITPVIGQLIGTITLSGSATMTIN